MDLAVWRNTELCSFQHHPLVSCTAGCTGEQPSKLHVLDKHVHLDVLENAYQACSSPLQHLHFCVKLLCDDYIFAAQAPIFA